MQDLENEETLETVKKVIIGLTYLQPGKGQQVFYDLQQDFEPLSILDQIGRTLDSFVKYHLEPLYSLNKRIMTLDGKIDGCDKRSKMNEIKLKEHDNQLYLKVNNFDFEEQMNSLRQLESYFHESFSKLVQIDQFEKIQLKISKMDQSLSDKIDSKVIDKKLDAIQNHLLEKIVEKSQALIADSESFIKKFQDLEQTITRNKEKYEASTISLKMQGQKLKENIEQIDKSLSFKVSMNEFLDYKEQKKSIVLKEDLQQLEQQIFPKIKDLQQEAQKQKQQSDSLRKVVEQIDYNLLGKANKMDAEIMFNQVAQIEEKFKSIEDIFSFYKQEYEKCKKEIDEKLSLVTVQAKENLKNQLLHMGETIIKEQVEITLSKYNLEKIIQTNYQIQLKLEKKADQATIDFLTQTKVGVKNFDSIKELCQNLLKGFKIMLLSNIQFMQTIGLQEYESVNARKSEISKSIFSVENILEQMRRMSPQYQNQNNNNNNVINLTTMNLNDDFIIKERSKTQSHYDSLEFDEKKKSQVRLVSDKFLANSRQKSLRTKIAFYNHNIAKVNVHLKPTLYNPHSQTFTKLTTSDNEM